jgi:hypothetical protein
VAFFADVIDPAGLLPPARGLWASDVGGELHLIALQGDTLTIAPGDMRTVASVYGNSVGGGQDGMPSAFNDAGQIAFSVSFGTNAGNAIVVATMTVPEPIALPLCGAALVVVRRRPRRA